MPFVNVKLIKGVFSAAEKKELLRSITDALVAVKGEHVRELVSVAIEEVKSGDWAIGGKPLTTADVLAHAAGTGNKKKNK
jgi:4-oxalocrotonate tautomerase